jgi:tetratricopeptide (TPR) repeat protein
MRFCYLSTLVLFVFLMAMPSQAQIIAGNTITGKVRNANGKALSNVILELHTGNGMLFTQTVSDSEGNYTFAGLEAATFVLVVNESLHQPFSERIELARTAVGVPGETVRVDVTLAPKNKASEPRAGLVFQQDIPNAAREAFNRAIKLAKENKSSQAIEAFREAIKIFPDYFDAHFALGNELMKTEKLNEAIAELEQARRINPKDDRVYQSFGLILSKQKKYAVAAAVFAEASRINPADPQILLLRGIALIDYASSIDPAVVKDADGERHRAFEMAEKDLLKASDLSGRKLFVIHLQLARLYEKRGERTRAADELEEYLRLKPDADNAVHIREAIQKLRGASKL